MKKNVTLSGLVLIVLVGVLTTNVFADSIESIPVGPGVVHHHEFKEAGPWHVHVLEIDLSVEWIHLETVKANDRLSGNEKTSLMAARKDHERHKIVGAINADFYNAGGVPVGAQVFNGILLKRPTTRSVFGTTIAKQPLIQIVSFQGVISTRGGSFGIDGVNEARGTNDLILYNKYFGGTTQTNYWGTEVKAENLSSQVAVNDTILVLVTAKDSIMAPGHGNNTIPSNGLVVSGHGTASTFLSNHVLVGDTLSVVLQLPPSVRPILELIGGTPRLIRNGAASVEWDEEGTGKSFAHDRHPRTAVGFSQDSTKVYFFTVDGRQPGYSVGMSLFELADYMLEWDVYQGVNLDGGGSTTMVVRGRVVNSPSDAGGERAVANTLMVVSTAPTGEVSILRIDPQEAHIISEKQVQFTVEAFDQYFNPVHVQSDSLVWTCDSVVGVIDAKGLFTAGDVDTSGYVYVAHGVARDSALVHITSVDMIELLPNPVILQVGQQLEVSSDSGPLWGDRGPSHPRAVRREGGSKGMSGPQLRSLEVDGTVQIDKEDK